MPSSGINAQTKPNNRSKTQTRSSKESIVQIKPSNVSVSAHTRNLKSFERAQVGVNLLLDKESHSVFLPYGGEPTKPKNWNLDISASKHSASLIQRMGSSGGRPLARSVVVLKGRRVVKKTYVRNKLPKNVVGLSCDRAPDTDGGLVKERVFADDGDCVSLQGE